MIQEGYVEYKQKYFLLKDKIENVLKKLDKKNELISICYFKFCDEKNDIKAINYILDNDLIKTNRDKYLVFF